MSRQPLRIIWLGLLTLVSGFLLWHLTVPTFLAGQYFYNHSLLLLLLLWLVDERLLLLAIAWLAPLLLINVTESVGYFLLDSAILMVLFRDALRRLLRELRVRDRAPEPERPPLPAWISLSLLALFLVTLAASLQVAPLFLYSMQARPLYEHAGYLTSFIQIFMFANELGAGGWSIPIRLLMMIGLFDYCYRRCDAAFIRQFMLIGGIGLLLLTTLGLLEYFRLLDLRWWRPNREALDYIYGSRRLMGLAQHSAWYAQYFVLTWPFLLILMPQVRGRARSVLYLLTFVLIAAAMLTLQRAFWLILLFLAAGLVVRELFRWRRGMRTLLQTHRRTLVLVLLGFALFALVADLASNHALTRRAVTLLRYRDRLHYVYSSLFFLTESPAGIGADMHAYMYAAMFVPLADFYQLDHGTAHNLWLHLAAERSPAAALGLLLFAATLLLIAWRARLLLPPDERNLAQAVALAVGGIIIYGAFQYIFYIRIVETYTFILSGMVLALCWPRLQPRLASSSEGGAIAWPERILRIPTWLRTALVVLVGVVVLLVAEGQRRLYLPSHSDPAAGDRLHFDQLVPNDPAVNAVWTGQRWRVALPCSAEELELLATSVKFDNTIRLYVGGELRQMRVLPAGQTVHIHVPLKPYDAPVWRKFRWLEVAVSNTVQEAVLNPEGPNRTLGVYLSNILTENKPAPAPASGQE